MAEMSKNMSHEDTRKYTKKASEARLQAIQGHALVMVF